MNSYYRYIYELNQYSGYYRCYCYLMPFPSPSRTKYSEYQTMRRSRCPQVLLLQYHSRSPSDMSRTYYSCWPYINRRNFDYGIIPLHTSASILHRMIEQCLSTYESRRKTPYCENRRTLYIAHCSMYNRRTSTMVRIYSHGDRSRMKYNNEEQRQTISTAIRY